MIRCCVGDVLWCGGVVVCCAVSVLSIASEAKSFRLIGDAVVKGQKHRGYLSFPGVKVQHIKV